MKGDVGAPSPLSQAQHSSSSSEASLFKTLTDSRTETGGRERHRLGDRLNRVTHRHTSWPLPLVWFTLALGLGSEGSDVGPELWAGL